ncbi:uncharacterized protein [Mytilus edulis]|uniref:uncharacterized protein n=1 Tax=Mytilus edulis TaxID=6550 RepID=UPI0039F10E6C
MFYVYLKMQLIQTVLLIYTAVSLHSCMSLGDEEGWTLVYKIVTGGNGSAYDLFMSNYSLNVYDEEAMSLNCSKNPSKKHFKSDIVNYWSIIGIHQVRVSVYISGIEQVFLLFNGTQTNKTNWFNERRLINSSYRDLNVQKNVSYFSVDGIAGPADHHYGDNYSRRFYIRNETDGECKTKDNGWLLVGDDKGACNYERDINKKPFILFSNPPSISKASKHELADSLAIFIKFSSKANCLNPFVINCIYGYAQTSTNLANIPSTNPAQTSTTSPAQTSSTSPAQTSSTSPAQTSATSPAQTSATNPAQTSSTTTEIRSVDLQNKLDQIKIELTVQRKSTQKYRRSLTSAPDERTSSKLMGIIGGTFIISVIGFIVLLDCATCNMGRHGKAKKGNN